MWINEQIRHTSEPEAPFWGTVTALRGNLADISSHTRLANAPCVVPFGMTILPKVGDLVLVLPTTEGYVCLGIASQASAGEIRIQNTAGASIRLCTDGSIRLNGTVIPKD